MGIIRPIRPPLVTPLARALADGGGLPWDRRDGGGPLGLDLLNGGTFSRASEGSYLTGAPTDGSAAFLAWAAANQRRLEDRGDGLGVGLLMEGSRTNYIVQSRDMADAAWLAGNAGSIVVDAGPGPDAAVLADESITPSGAYGKYQVGLGPGVSLQVCATQWARRLVAVSNAKIGLSNGDGTDKTSTAFPITTTYQRIEQQINTGPVRLDWLYIATDGRSTWGGTDQDLDVLVDLHQIEYAYFPSSAIRSGAAATTRDADSLSYAVGQYPASFLDRGFSVVWCPDNSSTEHIADGNTQRVIFCNSGTNLLQIQSGAAVAQFYCNGTLIAQPFTWARGSRLVFTLEPTSGRITIAGALTGNGSTTGVGAAWPAAPLFVGNDNGGFNPAFGRFFSVTPV